MIQRNEQSHMIGHRFWSERTLWIGTYKIVILCSKQKYHICMTINISMNVNIIQMIPTINQSCSSNQIFLISLQNLHQKITKIVFIKQNISHKQMTKQIIFTQLNWIILLYPNQLSVLGHFCRQRTIQRAFI